MEDNFGETFLPTSLLLPMAEEHYVPGFMNDPLPGICIQQPLHNEIMQIGPTGHNTEQGSVSGSGLPLQTGYVRFGEQGSGLPQANMVGTDVTAAVTGRPGHDNGIQRFQGHNMLQIEPTGHKTEQGSGSGLPQANMVETEATAAVPGRPGQKRNGGSNSAKSSKISRDKKKKEVDEMKEKMQWLQEKKRSHQKGIKKLKKNLNESNREVNVLRRKIRQFKARLARSKKTCDGLQIQTNSLSQTVVNMSSLQEENRRLQADKDLLMQQVNAGTNAKKWVKIPLEDRKLKIEGNVLFLKMA